MTLQVRVEGLRELRRAFRNLPPEYRKELREIHRKSAEPVGELALRMVPRRTGRLAQTIRVLATQKVGRVAAGNNTTVPYAGPIHYGWPARNIEPQPFLTDALAREQPRVIAIWEEETDRLIDKVWRLVPRF